MIFLISLLAFAGELHPVRAGDTPAKLATEIGDPELEKEIRALNHMGPSDELVVGTLIELPNTKRNATNQDAFLTALRGSAILRRADGSELSLSTFTPIRAGQTVCTANTATATLRLATQCVDTGSQSDDIVLFEDTCVRVENAFASTENRSTVITVLSGSIAVEENEADGSITVLTSSGLTTGDHGGYRVTVEDSAMRAEALYGDVAVSGSGVEVAVKAGQGNRTKTGEAPGAPVDLLSPGDPAVPRDGASLRRPSFRWSSVEEAYAYKLEISANNSFTDIVFRQEVKEPALIPQSLTLPTWNVGSLWWRVSSLDRFGFEGIPSKPNHLRLPKELLP